MYNKMAACEDPYRELELYLKEAQEEIGKAVQELEQHETSLLSNENYDEVDCCTLLPPPQEFSSPFLNSDPRDEKKSENISRTVLKRVCHDGNVIDFRNSSERSYCKQDRPSNSFANRVSSTKPSFSSSLSYGTLGRYSRPPYSPATRKRLWQMHPSISFPETSTDFRLLGKETELYKERRVETLTNGYSHYSNNDKETSQTNKTDVRHRRQRSNSDNSFPHTLHASLDDAFCIPRPPSGDVNLLSIWANNLVLELNKSFSEEFNSNSSFSPTSDYSLSPNKSEEINTGSTPSFDDLHLQKPKSEDTGQLLLPNKSLKLVSMSPDSGIEHLCCETLDMGEAYVDSLVPSQMEEKNYELLIPESELQHITPPPPEFEDEKDTGFIPLESDSKHLDASDVNDLASSRDLKAAVPLCEIPDMNEVVENFTLSTDSVPQALAPSTVELEKYCVVETQYVNTICSKSDSQSQNVNSDSVKNSVFNRISSHDYMFSSLPKPSKASSSETEKWTCSLPRDSEKITEVSPQRSASQSAITSISHVSIDELAAFMRRMKSSCCQFPTCADVSTDVKEDNDIKDAVTQTTPVPLSRSSSFTWVTDCDCSDTDLHNIPSGSEDSHLMIECADCKAETNENSSSSSSLGISSDEDCDPLSPGSGSSLYLSACSGSSDSFDEATVAEAEEKLLQQKKFLENSVSYASRHPFRSPETTLRMSTLGDISEEQVTGETVSMKSTISNTSLLDSNSSDQQGHSASFPSTLKVPRKNKTFCSPAQPIEPTVLVINDLNLKSSSAPVLLRQKHYVSPKVPESSSSDSSPPTGTRNKDAVIVSNQIPARSHSAKELNELQAIEACSWLRAAGFPQYAQMYEDNQFPIDICMVQKDHAFLPPDSIQSLFRRLNTLNRCAKMKFADHSPRKSVRMDESDEEEQFALSENWEFQSSSRRWSRIPEASNSLTNIVSLEHYTPSKSSGHSTGLSKKYLSPEETYCSSHDSVYADEHHNSPDSIQRSSLLKSDRPSVSPTSHIGDFSPVSSSGSGGTLSLASEEHEHRNLRRSGSDRVKEGAKALLKRMESLKDKKKKKGHDSKKGQHFPVTNSGTDGSSSSSLASSPQFSRTQNLVMLAQDESIKSNHKKEKFCIMSKSEDTNAHSDSECRTFASEKWKDSDFKNTKLLKPYSNSQTLVTVTVSSHDSPTNTKDARLHQKADMIQKKNLLHSHLHSNSDWEDYGKRVSIYDNIVAPLAVFNELCAAGLDEKSRSSTKMESNLSDNSQNLDDEEIIIINTERRDSGVGSSLTRGMMYQQAPWHCFPLQYSSETKSFSYPVQMTDLTAPQILLLRKLSLLKLTTIMEKYLPSSRTGWNWGVPKFIRRIRNPDYKDKVVFGVPLLLTLQRTGQPLPVSIQAAINYLKSTALDSTGLFRKSGVRSRIQKLKNLNESNPDKVSYEEQQAYDVADMLKQYFRELPEALLTNKLSETFISIFQCIPSDLRLEAIQAALMLMPDENREVLQSLLEFLYEVCEHSGANQMTATNIAVCFAPSLFHLSSPRSASSSPRRRKTVGVPDMRELNENRAAYECLSCMVSNYKTLFSISEEMISQSRILSTANFQPATLDELSSFANGEHSGLKGYIESCIQSLLKETKDKCKGWINVSQNDSIDLSYKKLSDGHPLRIWKISTEVEAPPIELLSRLLRERHVWDTSFIKWKVISRPNNQTEIFQYLCSSLPPHPPCDYCVLRSWRTDLPKGACVLIETSINHSDAESFPGSVRALTLASRYLIEPCGSGKSRITHLSRVDTRGRSPEWYNRAYGHICVLLLTKLRNSFSHTRTDGPETKV